MFADDLNCYRKYHRDISNASISKDLKSCQSSLHDWGRTHQVEFESTKESMHVLCSRIPKGEPFKILGITFDTKLVMYNAVILIVAESSARIKMLMRVRPFYSISVLMTLYKCHVLSFIESGTPAYYHAVPNILKLIDGIQDDFLEVVGISKKDAILHFNLAPLCTRRDIAM